MSERLRAESSRVVIQALDRGLQLLDLLGQSTELVGLGQLAQALQVDRSTAHRLLSTLQGRGYVIQDPDSKRYRLGMKPVELSRQALHVSPLKDVSPRLLRRLAQDSGESVNLFSLSNDHAVCVGSEATNRPFAVVNEIGNVIPLYCTAAGKVLLAFMTPSKRDELIEQAQMTPRTPRTVTSPQALRMQLEQVRWQGYAVDDEELYTGVRCIGAPVFNHSGEVVAGLSLSGPSVRVTVDHITLLAQMVCEAAQEISHALGWDAERSPGGTIGFSS